MLDLEAMSHHTQQTVHTKQEDGNNAEAAGDVARGLLVGLAWTVSGSVATNNNPTTTEASHTGKVHNKSITPSPGDPCPRLAS
ncbi:hypothetical protein APTSU1_000555400 [Apodemus speciosus]|uniref:Uncharacterized protein n=1 Tax=Apodemus speciosus TaxID=105296 RepID=A0ABQ0ETH5_APOSI